MLASEAGGLKDVPTDATAVPLINMVDDPDLEATAREGIAARGYGDRRVVVGVSLAELREVDVRLEVDRLHRVRACGTA